MADLEKIAEDLSNLTVIEAAELSTMLEEKWGVSAAAPVAVAAATPGATRARGRPRPKFTAVRTFSPSGSRSRTTLPSHPSSPILVGSQVCQMSIDRKCDRLAVG